MLSSLGQPTVKNFPEEDSKDERKTSCVCVCVCVLPPDLICSPFTMGVPDLDIAYVTGDGKHLFYFLTFSAETETL
jgi:hypothetical protein